MWELSFVVPPNHGKSIHALFTLSLKKWFVLDIGYLYTETNN